jgi:MFS family permease
VRAVLGRVFASLLVPNYRRYFFGQLVSVSGNWMQRVAEMWLILELTKSGAAVGLAAALQFLPILLLGVWGGLLADRMAKRTLLTATQLLLAVPAVALWGLTASGVVQVWMVYGLVLVRGAVTAVDNPARHAFAMELVGPDRLVNAIALNSVIVHASRIVGPAAAGLAIAALGVAPCFAVNAFTFGVMAVALRRLDPAALNSPRTAGRGRGQLRSVLRSTARDPNLAIPLAMMALVGTVSFNLEVLIPLLAAFTWHGTASTYAALMAAMATGAVLGSLATGSRTRVTLRWLVAASFAFGACELVAAAAPTVALQLVAFMPLGAASVAFAAGVNSFLQVHAEPSMRGRVMALYSVVYLGSTAIGAPIVGWLADVLGPRAGLIIGGAAALAAAVGARVAFGPRDDDGRGPRPPDGRRVERREEPTERRRNRTFQPQSYCGLPVLKTGWATRPLPPRPGS